MARYKKYVMMTVVMSLAMSGVLVTAKVEKGGNKAVQGAAVSADRSVDEEELTAEQTELIALVKKSFVKGFSAEKEEGMKRLLKAQTRGDIAAMVKEVAAGTVYYFPSWAADGTLIWAVMHGYTEVVKTVLETRSGIHNPFLVNETYMGITPLVMAVVGGYADIVVLLLAHNAELHGETNEKKTALQYAVQFENGDIAHLLVQAGADVQVLLRDTSLTLTEQMRNTLDAAEHARDAELQTLQKMVYNARTQEGYKKIKQRENMLLHAVVRGDMHAVDILLNAGVSIACADSSGYTPLMLAVKYGHTSIVNRLFDINGSSEKIHKQGITPLMVAVGSGRLAMVKLLCSKKVNINESSIDGTTALMVAAYAGDADIVKLLIEKGAQVNLVQKNGGLSALLFAALGGHSSIVNMLVVTYRADTGCLNNTQLQLKPEEIAMIKEAEQERDSFMSRLKYKMSYVPLIRNWLKK